MGIPLKHQQNVQEVVQEVLFQEVVQEVVQVDQVDQGFDQVVAPLDALSVVRQAPDDEGVPGELRGHPQGGYLRSPAPQAHDGRLRWLPRPTTAPSTAPLPRPPCPTLPPCPTAPTAPPTTAPTAPPTKVVHPA